MKKETINISLDTLKKSPKQKEILFNIISKTKSNSYLKVKDLKNTINFSDNSLKGLEKKGFISIKKIKIDRNESEQKFHQKIPKTYVNVPRSGAFWYAKCIFPEIFVLLKHYKFNKNPNRVPWNMTKIKMDPI